jgi:glycosyltransferase involved in cell wall biosynthesis
MMGGMGDDSARRLGVSEPARSLFITEGRPVDPDFVRIIGERLGARPECFVLRTAWTVRAPKIIRHFTYFFAGFRIARKRSRYRYLIFFQQTVAYHYTLWSSVLRPPAPVAVSPLILKPRRGPWGAVRERAEQAFVRSRNIDAFMVFSRRERDRYSGRFGLGYAAKLRFILLGGSAPLPPETGAENGEERTSASTASRYHFSGGASNRDYGTLFKAFSGLDEKLVVCCAPGDIKGLSVPARTEIVHGAVGEAFIERLRSASSVIIPLNEADYSSGQIALIQAMRHGKPVVVTEIHSVTDYVDGQTVLFVRPGRAEDIAAAVRRLASEPGLAASLGRAARAAYEKDLTAASFAERIADVLAETERIR